MTYFKMWVQSIGKLELGLGITWGNALKEYVTHLLAKPIPSVGTPPFQSKSKELVTCK